MKINKLNELPIAPFDQNSLYFIKTNNEVDSFISNNEGTELNKLFIQNKPALLGPLEVEINSDVEYIINDYNFNTHYNITVEGGTFIRNNSYITFTAQSTPTNGWININGNIFNISIKTVNTAPNIKELGFITKIDNNINTANEWLYNTVILPDNKIVMLTNSDINNDVYNSRVRLTKLNEDSSLDTTFGDNGSLIISDNIAYMNAFFYKDDLNNFYIILNDQVELKIKKVLNTGLLDDTFGTVTINNPVGINVNDFLLIVNNFIIHDNNKKSILMTYLDIINNTTTSYVLRLNADNTIDTNFGVNGYFNYQFIKNICKANDDDLIVLAIDSLYEPWDVTSQDYIWSLIKINSTAGSDLTFGVNGVINLPNLESNDVLYYQSVLQDSNDKLILNTHKYNLINSWFLSVIKSYNVDGSINTLFGNNGTLLISNNANNFIIFKIIDKLVVIYSTYNKNNVEIENKIIKLNSNGSIDTSFAVNGTYTYKRLLENYEPQSKSTDILLDSNNKLIIGTNAVNNGSVIILLTRLNSDGSHDLTFNGGNNSNINEVITYKLNSNTVLFPNINVTDLELSSLNSGVGNFNGASLTITRYNGNSPNSYIDDIFSPINNVLFDNNYVKVNNVVIGTYINSNGILVINFTSTNATNLRVNTLLRNISYRLNNYINHQPWSIAVLFNDGNNGDQGLGGSLSTIYKTIFTPEENFELSSHCSGYNKIIRYTDGLGGYLDITAEQNSLECGYDPYVYPAVNNIPQPTMWINTAIAEGVITSNNNKSITNIPNSIIIRSDAVIASGKWYWEISTTANNLMNYITPLIGVSLIHTPLNQGNGVSGLYYYDDENGNTIINGIASSIQFNNLLNSDNYVFGIALDMDLGNLIVYDNSGNIVINTGNVIDVNKAVSPTVSNSTTSQLGVVTANFGRSVFAHSIPYGYRRLNDLLLAHDSFTENNKINLKTHQTDTGQSWVTGVSPIDFYSGDLLNIEVNSDGSSSILEYDIYDTVGVSTPYVSASNKLADAWLNYVIPSYNYYIEALVEILPDANDSYFTIYGRIQNIINNYEYIEINWWPSLSTSSGRSIVNEINSGTGIINPQPIDIGTAYSAGEYLLRIDIINNECKFYINGNLKTTLTLHSSVVNNTSNGGYCGFGIKSVTTNLNSQGIKLLDFKVFELNIT
jgi:uncharacterized delta-60 repeat protein